MKPVEEFVQADKGLRRRLVLIALLYVLVLLWLEDLIDIFLAFGVDLANVETITQLADRKLYLSAVMFGLARSFPILLFLWVGYNIFGTASLPPRNWKSPITVRVVKGQNARVIGLFIMSISILLLFREISIVTKSSGVL